MKYNKNENFILESLKVIMNNDFSDVTKVYLYSHYLESVLISVTNANRLRFGQGEAIDYSSALDRLVTMGLLSSEVADFFSANKTVISEHLDGIIDVTQNAPYIIHEDLLARELHVNDCDVWFVSGKVTRDTTGSYYTPSDLALEVVREAIEKYLKINQINTKNDATVLLTNATFIDLSCGCGEFFKALINHLSDDFEIERQQIAVNLYGIDIDPIALQIAICDLLEFSDPSIWDDIISHFTLGNPLINQKNERGIDEKAKLFAQKRFYALDMGIDIINFFGSVSIDIVIGNPPWEKVRFEERKFFKPLAAEISAIAQKNKRQEAIENLRKNKPICYAWYKEILNDYFIFKSKIMEHPFISKTANGELNTYSLFAELSLCMINNFGVAALITKSALVTSPGNRKFFNYILKSNKLASLCLFNNSLRVFNIDSREKFCVITCTKGANSSFELIAGANKPGDLCSEARIYLSRNEVSVINPNTMMIPNISSSSDIEVLLNTHKRLPLFEIVYPNCHFGRLVHLTTHADYIETTNNEDNIPIYEGKFIERYNARFATFADVSFANRYSAKAYAKKIIKSSSEIPLPESRYFIKKDYWKKISSNYSEPFMLCWRSLTSTTNSRTTLAMLLPTMPTCQSIQFLQTNETKDLLLMLALFNSKPFDYFVRLKMPGIDLTQSVIKQTPVPPREAYEKFMKYMGITQTVEQHVLVRVAEVLSHEPMMLQILRKCNISHIITNEKKPSVLEKELDDLFYGLYGLNEAEVKIIQSSFKN